MFERLRNVWRLAAGDLELRATQIHTATDFGRDILINSPDGWEHDRQWLWWVDGPGGGNATGFGNPPPDARGFRGAEALPAVMRCTALIADTLAGLPWHVFRGYDRLPTPRWISDPQLLRPDARTFGATAEFGTMFSHVEFWANFITSAIWWGDAFAYATGRNSDGSLRVPLLLIPPDKVSIEGANYYADTDDGPVKLDPDLLIHVRGEPPYGNNQMGRGVLDRFASDFDLSSAMRAYAAGIFNTGIPSGYLKVHNPSVTQDQADTLKKRWMEQHGGPRRTPAVLNAATDFVPITFSPVDSQLDLARTWSLRDIALAFGVPAYMLGVAGDSSTYANVESRMIELRTFTLLPWIRRIEAALDAQFPAGTEVKIMTDGLMRADTATRYSAYESALRAGWLTADEVRSLEDRPPLPDAPASAPETPPAPATDTNAEGVTDGAEESQDDRETAEETP